MYQVCIYVLYMLPFQGFLCSSIIFMQIVTLTFQLNRESLFCIYAHCTVHTAACWYWLLTATDARAGRKTAMHTCIMLYKNT